MKPILLTPGEGRRGWMKLGNDASLLKRSVPESKNNRCYVSSHRHGGVREVGMLRSVIETSREVLADALSPSGNGEPEATHIASCRNSKGVRVCEEVGGGRSSDDGFVMKHGAKEPYLVEVNREGKDM
ncbi:MAG: hypothetical protein L3J39_16640 [Verrucomicrobiales bacterium]|nr:hypothetical protein [Verrucomicrobiales bacterium]